jgi:hypothetical protein
MKLIRVLSIFMAVLATVNSQAITAPTSLKDAMKAMSSCIKTISTQVTDPTQNPASAKLADDFVAYSEKAGAFVPSSVSSMPASAQDAAKKEYQRLIADSVQLGKDLAVAFRANDNATAGAILNQMAGVKKDGHNKFK